MLTGSQTPRITSSRLVPLRSYPAVGIAGERVESTEKPHDGSQSRVRATTDSKRQSRYINGQLLIERNKLAWPDRVNKEPSIVPHLLVYGAAKQRIAFLQCN